MEPKKTFEINIRKRPYEIETFKCTHKIPTVSYGFSEITNKLKAEYMNYAKEGKGKELGKLKKAGVEITFRKVTKKIAYVCDSTIKVLEDNPSILKYPIVIIECTFLVDDESTSKDHIYWSELEPYIKKNPDTLFVLIHFSRRYKDEEIRDFFDKVTHKNIKPWIQ